jgi:hypothetical protein
MLRHHHCHLLCHCAHGEAILRSCCLTSRQIRSWFSIVRPVLIECEASQSLHAMSANVAVFFEGFQAHNLCKSSLASCYYFSTIASVLAVYSWHRIAEQQQIH